VSFPISDKLIQGLSSFIPEILVDLHLHPQLCSEVVYLDKLISTFMLRWIYSF
jgi:hypothetical protein